MTTTIGGLSTSVIAVIAVGGVGLLLVLVVIIGYCRDLPARFRRRKATKEEQISSHMNDIDVEKNESSISVKETYDQNSQTSRSTEHTQAPSPLCTCEHPNIVTYQNVAQTPPMHAQAGPK